ncbi:MAG TPA: hypothetical protein ENN98_08030 [Desulfurivibrio alkaliphilus]|uniref:HAMP domain-containing protein n=1 Tax=Desulfurivibrio alkaliphilus TaxID=427923 RepID=A0A7C2TLP4_9BACT|nr:hypothetical protein [Desulfurivibrio alkaliphilus]
MQAGRGDFSHWVEVEAEGEIQDMAVQFNVMSQAIKRAMAEIKRKNWETEHLYSFVRDLSRENEWSKLCQTITDLLQKTFKAERVALLLRREKHENDITEICWRENGDRRYRHHQYQMPPPDDQLPAWVAQAREFWHNIPEGKPPLPKTTPPPWPIWPPTTSPWA